MYANLTYDLHSLGWNSFQQLCHTIAGEILGQTIESFLDSNDGGRDGAFCGHWKPAGCNEFSGRFVIQCKFTSKRDHYLRPSALTDELSKVARLIKDGCCDIYVLMTNAGLSGVSATQIKKSLKDIGVRHTLLLGSNWISRQISESKRLRMLVPRVYGLGDLSQIIDARAYSQSRAVLESMREDLAKVVVTSAYRKAASALDEHGFVLLVGEPAAGKTTIASLLSMAALDQWNASMLKLDNPSKVVEHWNPDEPSQFFWLDDAFGVSQYESFLVYGWNHIFPQIRTMLRKGAKVVMTSRDYIYNRARKELKLGAFPLLHESQVVIDVHDLTLSEKRQILYNHVKLGKQTCEFRNKIKLHLEAVAAHARFIPETARRLGEPMFTNGLRLDSYHLCDFVEKREQFLREVLEGLDIHSKAALALIYMRKDNLESPISLQDSEKQAIERLGSDMGGCISALESLNGSLVLHTHRKASSVWAFKHPTIGDAYAAILLQNPELVGIFVQGSRPEKLIEQVTCGDVGIEKAVIIPRTLFPAVIMRLSELTGSKEFKSPVLSSWHAKSAVQRFLAYRCSKAFLSLYLQENQAVLEDVCRPGLFLNSVPEVDLAIRLHELGLLPEDKRRKFVETVSEYAVTGEDLYALDNHGIRRVFEDEEYAQLIAMVRQELIPRLDDVRREWQSNHQQGESAEDLMDPLLDSFNTLKEIFGEDPSILETINCETKKAKEWIADETPEEADHPSRALGQIETRNELHGTRSIFDDIDE